MMQISYFKGNSGSFSPSSCSVNTPFISFSNFYPPIPPFGGQGGCFFCLSFVFPSPYREIVSLITPLSMTNNRVSFIVCSACFRAELSSNNDNFITVLFHCTLALGFKFFFKKYWQERHQCYCYPCPCKRPEQSNGKRFVNCLTYLRKRMVLIQPEPQE